MTEISAALLFSVAVNSELRSKVTRWETTLVESDNMAFSGVLFLPLIFSQASGVWVLEISKQTQQQRKGPSSQSPLFFSSPLMTSLCARPWEFIRRKFIFSDAAHFSDSTKSSAVSLLPSLFLVEESARGNEGWGKNRKKYGVFLFAWVPRWQNEC